LLLKIQVFGKGSTKHLSDLGFGGTYEKGSHGLFLEFNFSDPLLEAPPPTPIPAASYFNADPQGSPLISGLRFNQDFLGGFLNVSSWG